MKNKLLLSTILFLSLALTVCVPNTSDDEYGILPANIIEIDGSY